MQTMNPQQTFSLDGEEVSFKPGQTVIQAALTAGRYIPHLCYHPEFKPHGSCKLCTVKINGRSAAACTAPATPDLEVESDTPELNERRRALVQMLFVEGNHFCPSCEMSGNCMLQAVAYDLGVMGPHFAHLFPSRPVDASHPDILLDFNRCILCELCIRASAEVDRKNVFALSGPRHQEAPHRQRRIGAPGGHGHRPRRQGHAGVSGRRDPAEAPRLRRAHRQAQV